MHRPSQTPSSAKPAQRPSIICFAHLRWNLVFQRPQHIMTRLADSFDVLYWEEPREEAEGTVPRVEREWLAEGLERLVPVLPAGLDEAARDTQLRRLLDLVLEAVSGPRVFWY